MWNCFAVRATLVLCSFFVCSAATAALRFEALETDNGQSLILVEGEFSFDDRLEAFSKVVNKGGASVVTFDSPGGNIIKAIELGRLIRSYRLNTIQIRGLDCSSACSLAFMGGVQRKAEPGAIGVHKSSFAPGTGLGADDAVSAVQHITAEVIGYMTEMGVDPALLQLALQYESGDIRFLSGSEMDRYGVTNIGQQEPKISSVSPNSKAAYQAEQPLENKAMYFVESLIAVHSRNSQAALDYVVESYDYNVQYYGKQLTLNDVVKDKRAYFTRWPVRSYNIHPGSMFADCRSNVCVVDGIYDWWVKSDARHKQKSGAATFRYVLSTGTGTGGGMQVIGESGEVIRR